MEETIKAMVYDFDIIPTKQGTAQVTLTLKHMDKNATMDYTVPHLIAMNQILASAGLRSMKDLIGKIVEFKVTNPEEQWKNMV